MCVDYELGLSMEESKAFMAQFTSGKPFMSFQDFFGNLLGFPHDFFHRLRREAPVASHEGDIHGGPGYWILSRHRDR